MIGTTLSHYSIDAELGRGGMGIVYKARDTKLDRDVAIKVLPSAALASKDDRERFYREAKSAAQLHHPNIASVFEIDEAVPEGGDSAEPRPFIAMEFISGETLQELIAKAPMKLSDAVNVVAQVADALKAAHAKEIVHRDIKSANVMITADGVAKVLDFGLAKTNQSTMLTRMGSTLGTVAYMSPEQARGQEVDGRTDLYSLGTMLYEMVAGKLPFAGEYEQAVVYSILNEPPEPLTALRTGVPMQLEWIVNKLLAKDADYRYQTAADLVADLKSLDLSGSGQSRRSMPAMSAASISAASSHRGLPSWAYGIIAGALLIGAAVAWLAKPAPPEAPSATLSFPLDVEDRLDRTGRRSVAISPNGEFVAYVVPDGIRLQRTDNLGSSSLLVPVEEGTMGTRALFFSPDSRMLGFEDDVNKRLMRVDLSGSSPVRMADLSSGLQGAYWAENGDIYIGQAEGIGRLKRGSGTIETVIAPDSNGLSLGGPSLLPDGRHIIYTSRGGNDSILQARIFDLESGIDRLIFNDASGVRYASTGHLVFGFENTLYANPFDPDQETWDDLRVPLVENVMIGSQGTVQFDLSKEGTLIIAEDARQVSYEGNILVRVSPNEEPEMLSDQEKRWGWPDLSPDGRYVVAEDVSASFQSWDLWVIDTQTQATTRLTSNGRSHNGLWSPDGKRIAHADQDGFILARYPDDATKIDTLLHEFGRPTSWSADGKILFYEAGVSASAERQSSYLIIETGKTSSFPPDPRREADGNISPNGRWLAYERAVDGVSVYVLPFPEGGDPRLISAGFAYNPRWSADGERLYYSTLELGRSGMAYSDFDPETGVSQASQPIDFPRFSSRQDFAVDAEGRIIVVMEKDNALSEVTESESEGARLRFFVGFDNLLRERVGAGQ